MAALEAAGITAEDLIEALIMEYEVPDDDYDDGEAMNVAWVDVDIEVALDSGACDHIMDVETECPGYIIQPSPGSKK